jgi:hypothetical protein
VTDVSTAELLGHTQATLGRVEALHGRHADLLERLAEPAQLVTLSLTPQTPSKTDAGSIEKPSLSLGVLNPNAVTVVVGIGGGTASFAAEGVPVGPNQLLVLPVTVAQLEIAADPTELSALGATPAAQTAIVFVFRYRQVQPAFLGVGV